MILACARASFVGEWGDVRQVAEALGSLPCLPASLPASLPTAYYDGDAVLGSRAGRGTCCTGRHACERGEAGETGTGTGCTFTERASRR